jgi:hypothetical protein
MTPLAVLAGLVLSLAPADDGDDAREKCLASCEGTGESDTDRESCRLSCNEAARSRTAPNVVRTKRTEYLGGAPPGSKTKGGTTTTTTIESPSGTTTTHESTIGLGDGSTIGSRGTQAPAAAPADGYGALAGCQLRCDGESGDGPRAACKLGCLRLFPTPPRRPVFVVESGRKRDRKAASGRR